MDNLYYFNDTFKMHYYFADTEKKMKKINKHFKSKIDVSEVNGKFIALKLSNGQIVSIIFARDKRGEILAHECVHASFFLMETIGQEVKDDEVMPHIVEEIYRAFIDTLEKSI